MKKHLSILFLLVFLGINLKGQTEKLSYEVYYNWGFIWIDAGTLLLTATPDTLDNTPVVRLDGMAKSLQRWNWLYKLDDHYTSWCYPGSYHPLLSTKNTLEGGYRINNSYQFNYADSLVYIRAEETRKPLTLDTLSLHGILYDAQSATNKLRFIDVSSLDEGDTITLPILMDGLIHQQAIVYRGVDTLVMENKHEYRALRFSAIVTGSKLFNSEDAIQVWISSDEKRIPLYIEADITVGAVKIFYKRAL